MSDENEKIDIDVRIVEELLKDDVLGQIYDCYVRKDFSPSVIGPVVEGGVIIGTMTDIEKAMHTVGRRAAARCDKMIDANIEAARSCGGGSATINEDEIARLSTIAESALKLMWGRIRRRLGSKACGGGIELAADYQIVRTPPREEMKTIMVIGGEERPKKMGKLLEMLETLTGVKFRKTH